MPNKQIRWDLTTGLPAAASYDLHNLKNPWPGGKSGHVLTILRARSHGCNLGVLQRGDDMSRRICILYGTYRVEYVICVRMSGYIYIYTHDIYLIFIYEYVSTSIKST